MKSILKKLTTPLAIVFMAMLVVGATAAIVYTLSIDNNGTINTMAGLEVTDGSGNQVSTIAWGDFNPSQQKSQSFTITNTGNAAVQLNMAVSGMSPAGVGVAGWNLEGQTINAGQSMEVIFTFTAASNAPAGGFSYTMSITGSN